MICKSISLKSFRNLEDESCSFCDGVNLLWGKNAQGKSNILEGVYFFARGKSFRGAKEKELIKFGGGAAYLSLTFQKDADTFPVELSAEIPAAGKKTLLRNGGKLPCVRDMIGDFRAVLFCPSHLSLVGGAPAVRRNFMDIALSQLYPAYLESLSKYKRLLLQRNALIKDCQIKKMRPGEEIWQAYAAQMTELACEIAAKRFAYMSRLNTSVHDIFQSMTGGRESPTLTYRSELLQKGFAAPEQESAAGAETESGTEFGSAALSETDPMTADIPYANESDEKTAADIIFTDGKSRIYKLLTENIDREIKNGATLFGIHKDDISVKLNEKQAKLFASQGQQRSIALAMKLAEGEISKEIGGEYPVFLLDDVLSELDGERRNFVLSKLHGRQIIVTSCEPELFYGGGADRLIHIENGKIMGTE